MGRRRFPRAYLDLDARGELVRVRHVPSAPAIFRAVVRGMLSHMHIALPEQPNVTTWAALEPGPSGAGPTTWTWERPLSFTRTREAYAEITGIETAQLASAAQTLYSEARVRIDPAGHLASLTSDEDLVVAGKGEPLLRSKQSLRFDSIGVEAAEPVALAEGLEAESPGDVTRGASKEEEWKQVAGGWTLDSIEDALIELGRGRTPPSGFLVEASAYLKLHPEECAGLATLFPDPRLTVAGRERLLDVLAAAGGPEAQDALRDALAGARGSTDDARFASYLQHVGALETPTENTIAYLRQVHASDGRDPHARRGAIVALGVAASRLAMRDRPRARREADAIIEAIRSAPSSADRRAAILGLGNVAMVEDVPVLAAHAHDREPEVRSAVALALRQTESAQGHAALLAMLSDPDVNVQRIALDSLTHLKLDPSDMRVAAEAITAGRTSAELASRVVALCAANLEAGPPVRLILVHLLERVGADHRLEGRIQSLLERIAT